MKRNLQETWKDVESFAVANDQVEINTDLMSQIYGGEKSAGYICSFSGECNSSGASCTEQIKSALNSLIDMF